MLVKLRIETRIVLCVSRHQSSTVDERCVFFLFYNRGCAVTIARMSSRRRACIDGCAIGECRRESLFAEASNVESIRGHASRRVELMCGFDGWREERHHTWRMRTEVGLRRVLRLRRRRERWAELLHLWCLKSWPRVGPAKAVRMCHLRMSWTPWIHSWVAWMARTREWT